MIIQNPDGSYECCLLPSAAVLWLRTLLRRARRLLPARGEELRSGGDGGQCS